MAPLMAYIDPGTGALVLQVLIATILTAGVVARRLIFRPVTFLREMLGRKSDG